MYFLGAYISPFTSNPNLSELIWFDSTVYLVNLEENVE